MPCVVNKKKNIRLKNRTKYFDVDVSKTHVRFSSPESYQSRQIKIEGYETRLYYQFRYCEEHDGQVFFYTLTYNDAAMPSHYGINCFDYEDLRDLLIGGFNKQLLRKYGTRLKYFVGAELGDGKGVRGMHNNPHYHALFFLEPCPFTYKKTQFRDVPVGVYLRSSKYHRKGETKYKRVRETIEVTQPYVKISPTDFRHLVRMYWQGFDEDTDGFRDYNDAKYGIAREGDNVGKVTDFRAIGYVAKYVCKDAHLKMHEEKVERIIRYREKQRAKDGPEVYRKFLREVVYDMYNTPLNASKTSWCFDDKGLILTLLPDQFVSFVKIYGEVPDSVIEIKFVSHVLDIVRKYHLCDKFNEFLDSYIAQKVDDGMSEYRNRYCNKCRISQGVGDYALQFIYDKMNPIFQVPSKKGPKNRPMSQYYYRKLFNDVITPTETSVFGKTRVYPPIRVLNEDGIKYKVEHLKERIDKMAVAARNNLSLILENEELFEKMKDSDINTEVWCTHVELINQLNKINDGECWRRLFTTYAEFKLVYEDRYFKAPFVGDGDGADFPRIDVAGDYARFLVPTVYSVSRSDLRLDVFLEGNCEDYLPYSQHPYFLRYLSVFRVLDMCADYWFIQKDNKAQREAEEIAATRRFHSQRKLKEFYSQFK